MPAAFHAFESGFLHRPSSAGPDGLALTHGAGANCQTALLTAMANAFAEAGVTVYRFDLPFRRRRRQGPPHPGGASEDRAGIREAARSLRELVSGRIFIGGHSYGGRQASILAAEVADVADGLLLLSYPLHPPSRPDQLRTAHFPRIRIPAFFVHGTRDPFATTDELSLAIQAIPGRKSVLTVEGAGHSLKPQIGCEAPQAFLSWLGAQGG
jgi:predicted alpha/beta-hydrolase family hydrolase